MFRVETTLQVERKGFPNRRVMTRGPNLVGKGGGTISPKFGKLIKLGKVVLEIEKKGVPDPAGLSSRGVTRKGL